jgi:hypothetical protein
MKQFHGTKVLRPHNKWWLQGEQIGTNHTTTRNKTIAPMKQNRANKGEYKFCIHGINHDYKGKHPWNKPCTRGTKVLRPRNKSRLQWEQNFSGLKTNHDYKGNKSFASVGQIMTTRGTKVLRPHDKSRLKGNRILVPMEEITIMRGTQVLHPWNKLQLQGI